MSEEEKQGFGTWETTGTPIVDKQHPDYVQDPGKRLFLKMIGVGTAVVGATALASRVGVDLNEVANSSEDNNSTPEKSTSEIIAEIETLSLEHLEKEVFENYPIVPNIEVIKDRINAITDIPEGSNIMKVGTSVARGMLESVYSSSINQSEINLGEEQAKLDLVLSHCQIPEGALEACSVEGADIDQILYEPMYCKGPMPCPPNTNVVDAYIDHYKPKIAINFIGTNMIRNEYTLEQFAESTEEMISHYIDKGVIPILTTFPHPPNSTEPQYDTWFNNPRTKVYQGQDADAVLASEIEYRSPFLPESALKYNLLLLKLAEKHQIPVINLERAVIESAVGNGTEGISENYPEIDPQHFSTSRELTALQIPLTGQKFETGEQAVSYFTLQTLHEILAHQQ